MIASKQLHEECQSALDNTIAYLSIEMDPQDFVQKVLRLFERDDAVIVKFDERRAVDFIEKVRCHTCVSAALKGWDFYPGHYGSTYCRSGSLRSGGRRPHCTCDTCF